MVKYSKCAYGPYDQVSFHIVKARPLHSIPCEFFAKNICPKHIFRFSRGGGVGGGSTFIYLQVCTFTL